MAAEHLVGAAVPVGRISARVLAGIPADATVRDAAEELVLDDVGLLAVEAARRAVGVVSERDVVTVLATGSDPDARQAAEIMSGGLVTVGPATTVADVGRLMVERGVRHVLVREHDEIAGIVSMRDVLAVLLDVDG